MADEPEIDRWGAQSAASKTETENALGDMQFFRLSGGILKTNAVTSNRIDDLLGKLKKYPSGCTCIPNIDKSLDYLFTYMKLDMIGRAADDVSG